MNVLAKNGSCATNAANHRAPAASVSLCGLQFCVVGLVVGGRSGAIPYAARSLTSADVVDLAQWAQQKNRPPTSTPCPITLHLQCSQIGAIAWIAHSKLSKVWCAPAAISSKLLSYSLPQTSHVAICHPSPTLSLPSGVRCLLAEDRCPGGALRVRITWRRVELPQPDASLCGSDCRTNRDRVQKAISFGSTQHDRRI
jgi:hypothetical protein